MKRARTALGATIGLVGGLLTTSVAHAQQRVEYGRDYGRSEFGQQGEFIISADRLFSLFSFSSVTQDGIAINPNNGTVAQSNSSLNVTQTGISLLWGSAGAAVTGFGSAAGAAEEVNTFFTIPRVGFDYVIIPNVTLGGDLALFFTLGGHTKATFNGQAGNVSTTTTSETDLPKNTIFGIAPRGGYILGINNLFSLWLRGGFSFYTGSVKSTTTENNGNDVQTTTISAHQFALDLDPQLVITPFPHVGFTAGLTLDVPLAGGHSTEFDTTTPTTSATASASASSSIVFVGITAGMVAYF